MSAQVSQLLSACNSLHEDMDTILSFKEPGMVAELRLTHTTHTHAHTRLHTHTCRHARMHAHMHALPPPPPSMPKPDHIFPHFKPYFVSLPKMSLFCIVPSWVKSYFAQDKESRRRQSCMFCLGGAGQLMKATRHSVHHTVAIYGCPSMPA